MATKDKKRNVKICLLGASFDTGNLGVSALAESSIKLILNRWPDAEIILLGSGYVPMEYNLSILGKGICVRTVPIRFSKNIFLPYHFLWFAFYASVAKLLPKSMLKDALVNRNPYFQILYEANLVADITGGDSFSDIYGFRRFFLGYLEKWPVIFLGKKLVLLPQTYGPFKKRITKMMARCILKRASLIYSRDRAGIEYVNALLNNRQNGKVRFAPDVAFILDSREPKHIDISPLKTIKTKNVTLVGLNVSGLLYNGGYTKNNMFGLKTDYRQMINAVIDLLMNHGNTVVLLVPHVFPPPELEVESDPQACLAVYESASQKYKDRMFLIRDQYNQNESKYIIGLCDFFIGSRMHACIAALSQGIPAVGLSYSKKFVGVFGSIGLEDIVVDMRHAEVAEITTAINKAFERREVIAKHLKALIPSVQQNILNIFEDIS
jgi:polysaccharide pyruvyl transferase WcaK-like protein